MHHDTYLDRLIRVTSEPPRLQPRVAPMGLVGVQARSQPIASLPITAMVERNPWPTCGRPSLILRPSVRVSEPGGAGCWDLRFRACCEVAEALVESFGGSWRRVAPEAMEIEYAPRDGSDLYDVERGAVAAFAVRGMHAGRQVSR